MDKMRFHARITKVAVNAPKEGGGLPIMTFSLKPRYDIALTTLARETGGMFSITFIPQELDLLGVDDGKPMVRDAFALSKVDVTPPKDDVGPTIQLTLDVFYSPHTTARLVARVGQRFMVDLEEVTATTPSGQVDRDGVIREEAAVAAR